MLTDLGRISVCLLLIAMIGIILQRAAMVRSLRLAGLKDVRAAGPRSVAGDLCCALIIVSMTCLFMLLTARPFMSMVVSVGMGALLVGLNGVKEKALREPLVVVDAWLLKQIFRYPHLYFPFLPARCFIFGAAGVILLLVLLAMWEKPLILLRTPWFMLLLAWLGVLPFLSLFLLNRGFFPSLGKNLLNLYPVSHDAARDAQRNGPLTSALLHPVLAGVLKRNPPDFFCADRRPAAARWPDAFVGHLKSIERNKPHVVLVQAESFFDFRAVLSSERQALVQDFLPAWDHLRARGRILPTPENAFGAYTIRTEFSVLTGLNAQVLGPWFYNPYLLASERPVWSMARWFNALGYRSLCLHAYAADFFNRDRVMPNLGFNSFVAVSELGHLPRFGPYISDLAFGETIIQKLTQAENPLFCFAVTMEAHGPWFADRLTAAQLEEYLPARVRAMFPLPQQAYLCHLKRMDIMFGRLDEFSARSGRPVLVFGYGDHAPGLSFA